LRASIGSQSALRACSGDDGNGAHSCSFYGGAAFALDDEGEPYDFDMWRMLPVRNEDDAFPIVNGGSSRPRVVHLHRYDRTPRASVRLTRRQPHCFATRTSVSTAASVRRCAT